MRLLVTGGAGYIGSHVCVELLSQGAQVVVLDDFSNGQEGALTASLRYFNPVGAHPSGELGEHPRSTPDNLFPVLAQVATGQRESLPVWGDDYATADGTAIRDYVHVLDVARGHGLALKALAVHPSLTLNLATGAGHSVRQVVRAFERACGRSISVRIEPRREGDLARSVADLAAAKRPIGWHAEHDLDAMCRDQWRWCERHPRGYAD